MHWLGATGMAFSILAIPMFEATNPLRRSRCCRGREYNEPVALITNHTFLELLYCPFGCRMPSHVVPKSLTSLGRRCSSMCVATIGEAWPLVCCGVGSVAATV